MKRDMLSRLLQRYPILKSRIAAVVVCSALTIAILCGFAFVQYTYVITDDDAVTLHYSFSSSPYDVLESLQDPPSEDDVVTIKYLEEGWHEITITRAKSVHLIYGEYEYNAIVYTETLSQLLEKLGVTVTDHDELPMSLDSKITEDCTIEITPGHSEIITVEASIPFGSQFVTSNLVADGESSLVRKGSEGVEVQYYEVCYKDGVEVSRSLLCSEITVEPVDEIIARGTVNPMNVTASDHNGSDLFVVSQNADDTGVLNLYGREYDFIDVLDIEATGYSCEGDSWRTTFTGTTVKVGTIAVDPDFIPLGSELIIVSDDGEYLYGYCVAEDTGSLVKGNIVDLYFNTDYECWQFGRRDCTAYVIKTPE